MRHIAYAAVLGGPAAAASVAAAQAARKASEEAGAEASDELKRAVRGEAAAARAAAAVAKEAGGKRGKGEGEDEEEDDKDQEDDEDNENGEDGEDGEDVMVVSETDKFWWACPRCDECFSIRTDSFFEASRLPLQRLVLLIYCFSVRMPRNVAGQLAGASGDDLSSWYEACHGVIDTVLASGDDGVGGGGGGHGEVGSNGDGSEGGGGGGGGSGGGGGGDGSSTSGSGGGGGGMFLGEGMVAISVDEMRALQQSQRQAEAELAGAHHTAVQAASHHEGNSGGGAHGGEGGGSGGVAGSSPDQRRGGGGGGGGFGGGGGGGTFVCVECGAANIGGTGPGGGGEEDWKGMADALAHAELQTEAAETDYDRLLYEEGLLVSEARDLKDYKLESCLRKLKRFGADRVLDPGQSPDKVPISAGVADAQLAKAAAPLRALPLLQRAVAVRESSCAGGVADGRAAGEGAGGRPGPQPGAAGAQTASSAAADACDGGGESGGEDVAWGVVTAIEAILGHAGRGAAGAVAAAVPPCEAAIKDRVRELEARQVRWADDARAGAGGGGGRCH